MRIRGTILAATCALSIAVAGPAAADQTTVKDAKGDVFKVGDDATEGDQPQGSVVNTDIRRSVVTHGKGSVLIRVTYDRLKKNRSEFIQYDAELRTPRSGVFHVLVVVDPTLKSATVTVTDGHYEGLTCRRTRGIVHPDEGRLLAKVPRACLGTPKWVRFTASALSEQQGVNKSYVDNALASGVALTERLYAG